MPAGIPSLRCVPLSARLSVETCAARHRKAGDPVCRACSVGAAHAAGETPERWPSGAPIVRVLFDPRDPHDRIPPRRRRLPVVS